MKLVANDYEAKDIFKIIREWTDLKQNDFAKTINRSKRSVQDYEGGVTKYSVNMLLEMAKVHGLTITIEKK